MNISNKEYEEYLKLKQEQQYKEWQEALNRQYEAEREARYQKDVEHNIEVMRNNGTLKVGEM